VELPRVNAQTVYESRLGVMHPDALAEDIPVQLRKFHNQGL